MSLMKLQDFGSITGLMTHSLGNLLETLEIAFLPIAFPFVFHNVLIAANLTVMIQI